MSDLTVFRDHARRMADATHRPDCPGRDPNRPYLKPDPAVCGGRITEPERALWRRLAGEVDAYLAGDACPDCGQPVHADADQSFFVEERRLCDDSPRGLLDECTLRHDCTAALHMAACPKERP